MGWMGKWLRVDLGSGRVRDQELDRARARAFIGGRGLGMSLLLEEVDPNCDPFGPDNKLIFMTGPLTGTKAPTGARYMVMTKSPLTGAVTCSNSGGQFPTMLKRTGYDGIIFEGTAAEPVYLAILDGRVELRSAAHLWGLTSHETSARLLAAAPAKARVACIGPAGENRVRFAAIMNDNDRAAGRSGVGAVMGAKNLKAVLVHGEEKVPIHDPAAFDAEVKAALAKFQAAYPAGPPLKAYGTANTIIGTQNVGALPTRNFQQGTFEHWQAIGGEALTEKYLVKAKACFSCPIACGRVTRIADGPFQGEGEGPEYETVYALGSNCGLGDLAALTKANYICNEMGLDTITMGATLACAMEMYEKGILDDQVVGRPLPFGDGEAIVELCRKTALREGFGDQLAEGSRRFAERYGHPELSVHAKGQEFAGYDPRAEQGMGLAYATSSIGASHMRGDPAYIEILGVPMLIDAHAVEGKAQLVKDWQDVFAVIDSAGLCVFFTVRNLVTPTRDIRPDGLLRLVNAATGAGYTVDSLVQAGERVINTERLFLMKAGFSARDDTLSERILKQPLPDGPAKGQVCRLAEMLPDYYRARGWLPDGRPSREKLAELGLAAK